MTLIQIGKVIKKLYNQVLRKKAANQDDARKVIDFMEKSRLKVLIFREYGARYNPQTKELGFEHYPIEEFDLYGYLHTEEF